MPCHAKILVRRAPARSASSYLERGSVAHLGRGGEKSSACAIAPDLLEPNILGEERYVAQTKDDVGRRENNMTQITSIKLGLIAICIATVPLSLAQTPRIGTSGSNQTGITTRAPAGHSGLSGNSTSPVQLGTNSPSSMSTGPNTNAGVHIGINAGAQIGISNPTGGITRGVAGGLGSSSGNSTAATQPKANTRAGTNTTANTNAEARTAAAAATPTKVNIIEPQFTPVPTPRPLLNNNALGPNFATPGESSSPVPSASPTPTPTAPPL